LQARYLDALDVRRNKSTTTATIPSAGDCCDVARGVPTSGAQRSPQLYPRIWSSQSVADELRKRPIELTLRWTVATAYRLRYWSPGYLDCPAFLFDTAQGLARAARFIHWSIVALDRSPGAVS
jgi:hypothetical protein